jgi:hypothetical protein
MQQMQQWISAKPKLNRESTDQTLPTTRKKDGAKGSVKGKDSKIGAGNSVPLLLRNAKKESNRCIAVIQALFRRVLAKKKVRERRLRVAGEKAAILGAPVGVL